MLSNYFHKKTKSKKGVTLVEVLCSVLILAIVFAGVLNAVAFSQQMVYTDNVRDKASDISQLVADEVMNICTGKDPEDTSSPAAIENDINDIVNNTIDPQYASIGEVKIVPGFTSLEAYDPTHDPQVQVMIEPVTESMADNTVAGIQTKETTQAGWNITLRVYYRSVNGKKNWTATEISAFAPFNTVN